MRAGHLHLFTDIVNCADAMVGEEHWINRPATCRAAAGWGHVAGGGGGRARQLQENLLAPAELKKEWMEGKHRVGREAVQELAGVQEVACA